jgi:hypothetical protein
MSRRSETMARPGRETGRQGQLKAQLWTRAAEVGHQALDYELRGERLGKNTVYRLLPRVDIRSAD